MNIAGKKRCNNLLHVARSLNLNHLFEINVKLLAINPNQLCAILNKSYQIIIARTNYNRLPPHRAPAAAAALPAL